MKVLIVCNNAHMKGNGVCSAVLALKSRLLAEGVETRILACENPDTNGEQPDYPLPHYSFPIFEPIIKKNGYRYPKLDKNIIEKAVRWADVVHLMEGFPLEIATVKIAQKADKPCVATYHIFTHNITFNLGIKFSTFINKLINKWWSSAVYNHCKYVQCPTQTVKIHLEENDYTAPKKVITNGIEPTDIVSTSEDYIKKPYKILFIGRLSNEKDPSTLIKAMKYSKYAADIQLYFAGNGPKADEIKKAACKMMKDEILKRQPIFGFYTLSELQQIAASSYLYIHCALVEVEGLSCIEAIQQGAVPIIASSKLSATSQFALDERSLFPATDAKKLAERIDWWIEHPEERRRMGKIYSESAKKYNAKESTLQIIKMYEEALQN